MLIFDKATWRMTKEAGMVYDENTKENSIKRELASDVYY
jgi:hypothetical protein